MENKTFSGELYRDDSMMEVKTSQFFNVGRLDLWLHHMQQAGVAWQGAFRDRLLSFYAVPQRLAAEGARIVLSPDNLQALGGDLPLARAAVLKNFHLMRLEALPAGQAFTVNVKDMLRAYLHKSYFLAKSLEAVMPKPQAIEFHQKLVDVQTRAEGTSDHPQQVADHLFANQKLKGAFAEAFNYSERLLPGGRVAKKITKCKWCEVLREVNDPDYAYAVACHDDFEATKVENPAFTLTRAGTLIQGRPYCDFLFHDTRIDKDPAHLPEDFWVKMG